MPGGSGRECRHAACGPVRLVRLCTAEPEGGAHGLADCTGGERENVGMLSLSLSLLLLLLQATRAVAVAAVGGCDECKDGKSGTARKGSKDEDGLHGSGHPRSARHSLRQSAAMRRSAKHVPHSTRPRAIALAARHVPKIRRHCRHAQADAGLQA